MSTASETMSPPAMPSPTALRAQMVQLFERATQLDLREYEREPVERVHAELRPVVLGIVRGARELLSAVIGACEELNAACPQGVPADGSREGNHDSWTDPWDSRPPPASPQGPFSGTEQVAFVALLSLSERTARIEDRETPGTSRIALLGGADSALRGATKALAAVENALALAMGELPQINMQHDTDVSLNVRRSYAKLRTSLTSLEPPVDGALYARLRGAGTQIAMLIGTDAYHKVRIRDRLVVRELQERILRWMRDEHRSSSQGQQLWLDLTAAFEMFSQINRRQELVQHDDRVIRDVLCSLKPTPESADEEIWQTLSALEGLDAELDFALSRPRATPAESLHAILTRLARRTTPGTPDRDGEG